MIKDGTSEKQMLGGGIHKTGKHKTIIAIYDEDDNIRSSNNSK